MAVEIPITSDDPCFCITVPLDDTDFILSFWWNTRESRWYLSVAAADGTALVDGIPLVIDYPLLNRFGSASLPGGMLMAIDGSGKGLECGRYDLGARVKLLFYTSDELAEVA
jgi:hypothetical protein